METNEILRRALDLSARAERRNCLTHTAFLTPAERYALTNAPELRHARMVFHGGAAEAERSVAFFLPEYLEEDTLDVSEAISAIHLKAHFGQPGHRDYLGALLGMGVERDCLGDILIHGDEAVLLCLSSIAPHLLSIDKVGRCSVTASPLALEDIPAREQQCEERRFTVLTPRLDAVVSGMFHISRSEAARQIAAGSVSHNYTEAFKPDREVHEGDVLSLRGSGKGRVSAIGGESRKGRSFVTVELYK